MTKNVSYKSRKSETFTKFCTVPGLLYYYWTKQSRNTNGFKTLGHLIPCLIPCSKWASVLMQIGLMWKSVADIYYWCEPNHERYKNVKLLSYPGFLTEDDISLSTTGLLHKCIPWMTETLQDLN